MYETPITTVGRLVTDVNSRLTMGGDKVANFRIACQERRFDKQSGAWVDGDRMYLAVVCWRKLADGVVASLAKGDQVIVTGRFRVREYTTEDGSRRSSAEIDARSVGPDLSWQTVLVNRSGWATADPPPEVGGLGEEVVTHPAAA
jgi:single-strand DNA-binding protein